MLVGTVFGSNAWKVVPEKDVRRAMKPYISEGYSFEDVLDVMKNKELLLKDRCFEGFLNEQYHIFLWVDTKEELERLRG